MLTYDEDTAGGLMTTEPVILGPEATIAEALAVVRRVELSPALAATVYVCRSPLETPTGKFLGVVHIQRLLREPPHASIGSILDTDLEPLSPLAPLGRVTRMLATYNLVGVPVVDDDGRLVGAVTVDDVLDHILPEDWREERHGERHEEQPEVIWRMSAPTVQPAWTSRERPGAACSAGRGSTPTPSEGLPRSSRGTWGRPSSSST